MMQIPPPSNSLLSAMFSKDAANNARGELRGDTKFSSSSNNKKEQHYSQDQQLQQTQQLHITLPSPRSRSELTDPSFAGSPPLSLPPTAISSSRRVRYDPSIPLKEHQRPSGVRRTGRRRSPPQKILRNTESNHDQENLSQREAEEERDEAGNNSSTTSIGCFSYRTKNYEKASQEMLERMQKSWSFEKKEAGAAKLFRPWNSCHLPESSEPDSSLKYPEDNGFYIEDESEDYLAASTPSLAMMSSYGDFDAGDELSCEDEEEGDEIFELDL